MKKAKYSYLLSGVGFAGGVAYAFMHRTGFWRGVGIALIMQIAGTGIGYGIDQFSDTKK